MAPFAVLFLCACVLSFPEWHQAVIGARPDLTRVGENVFNVRAWGSQARIAAEEGAKYRPVRARRELAARLETTSESLPANGSSFVNGAVGGAVGGAVEGAEDKGPVNSTVNVTVEDFSRGTSNSAVENAAKGTVEGAVHPADAAALQKAAGQWKKDINTHDDRNLLDTWNVTRPCSQWFGVTCDSTNHRVTAIKLPGLGDVSRQFFSLSGPVPAELGSLPELRTLILARNLLGSDDPRLPKGFARVGKLSHLDLSGNNFGGNPGVDQMGGSLDVQEICKLTGLTYLNLESTILYGLPTEFKGLSRLVWLDLSWTLLSKEDIQILGSLTSLKFVSLRLGLLTSDLVSLSRLQGLEQLDLSYNELESIPTCLKSFPRLADLKLRAILGSKPEPGLKVPSWLGSLQQLTSLDLSRNEMEGPVPALVRGLSRLARLDLSSNNLAGKVPQELLNSRSLTHLDLSHNKLNLKGIAFGPHASPKLKKLDLSANVLSGTIPSGLSGLTSLESLSLKGNQLVGTMPHFIWTLSTLTWLDLSKNSLTGFGVSSQLNKIGKLRSLHLSRNQFQGSIPREWSALTGLTALSLAYNNITGSIPQWLGAIRGLVALSLSSNHLTGSIPERLGSLKGLVTLSLSNNQLTGSIPGSLFRAGRALRLVANQLSGNLPANALTLVAHRVFAAVKEGTYPPGLVDVSGNYLTGPCYSSLIASLDCPYGSVDDICKYTVTQELQGLKGNCLQECKKLPYGGPPPQRSSAQCSRFCGADKRNGPCDGHGFCNLKGPKKTPACTCSKGFVAPASSPGTCVSMRK